MTNREWINNMTDREFLDYTESDYATSLSGDAFEYCCNCCYLKYGVNAPCFKSEECPDEINDREIMFFLKGEKLTEEQLAEARRIHKEGTELSRKREENKCDYCIHKAVCKRIEEPEECENFMGEANV